MSRSETDIRLSVIKQLAARGVSLPADAIEEVLAASGPELGKAGADGVLRVSTAQIAPGSAWMRENKEAWKKALVEGKVELVD